MAQAEAFRALQDTSLPKALGLISEDEIKGKLYETEGRAYNAGDYILREDITPTLLDAIDEGQYDSVLEPADRQEAEDAINATVVGVFAPEHAVEHEALVRAGHKIIDREQVLKLRSAGAEDARAAQEAAKADGADERPGLTFEPSPDPGNEDGEPIGSRVKDADDSYVDDTDALVEEQVQVLPSGVVASNPVIDGAKKAAAKKRPAAKPKASAPKTSGQDSE